MEPCMYSIRIYGAPTLFSLDVLEALTWGTGVDVLRLACKLRSPLTSRCEVVTVPEELHTCNFNFLTLEVL